MAESTIGSYGFTNPVIPYPFDRRAMTVGELTMEIQSIMNRVNTTFAGRSRVLAEEFLGLQEAIQATLAV